MRWIERHQTWIGFLFAFAAGVLVAAFFLYRDAKNFWDVLTAIGTLGAVFVAVGVPIVVRSREQANAMRRSAVAAAMMQGRTARMHTDSNNAAGFFEHVASAGPYPTMKNDAESHLEVLKRHIPWTIDEIARLSDLPTDCAFHMASGIGEFREAVEQLERLITLINVLNHDFSRAIAEVVGVRMRAAADHLGDSMWFIDSAVKETFAK